MLLYRLHLFSLVPAGPVMNALIRYSEFPFILTGGAQGKSQEQVNQTRQILHI